jgi:hypothetical protein
LQATAAPVEFGARCAGSVASGFLDRTANPSDNVCLPAAVAQVVERSPEKAGVGGSTPSRGTISVNHLQISSFIRFSSGGRSRCSLNILPGFFRHHLHYFSEPCCQPGQGGSLPEKDAFNWNAASAQAPGFVECYWLILI